MSVGAAIRGAAGSTAKSAASAGFAVNQTSFMFGALLLAFLFYITVRGDLAAWLGLLGLAGSAAPAQTSTSNQPGQSGLPSLPTLPSIGSMGGLG